MGKVHGFGTWHGAWVGEVVLLPGLLRLELSIGGGPQRAVWESKFIMYERKKKSPKHRFNLKWLFFFSWCTYTNFNLEVFSKFHLLYVQLVSI